MNTLTPVPAYAAMSWLRAALLALKQTPQITKELK